MTPITATRDLDALCKRWKKAAYITVDTEFVRTRTFYSQLCLIQVADEEGAAAIDPLAKGLDLKPFYDLMNDQNVVKVFHAARQDLEIFYHEGGVIPHPLFDTQIAAMVCGFGEQAGYETLVKAITGNGLDKSQRFTDWSKRPLSKRQLEYAISDVTHLRQVYKVLKAKLEKTGRAGWLTEEMDVLTAPATYENHPEDAWRRLKVRSTNRRFLAQVRALAEFREISAQTRDVPRNRIMDDKTLLQVAAHAPHSLDELKKTAGHARFLGDKKLCQAILDVVVKTEAVPDQDLPKAPPKKHKGKTPEGTLELLKVLLKHQCAEVGVATKLVATVADLEAFTKGNGEDVHFMTGWRFQLFGQYAGDLVAGRLALSVSPKGIKISKTD